MARPWLGRAPWLTAGERSERRALGRAGVGGRRSGVRGPGQALSASDNQRLCVGMLGDRHAAEDAAQDAFFSAWRSMGRFRGDAQFSTWLYRIATNQCLRDIHRRPAQTAQLPEHLPATEGYPHAELEAAEAMAAVSAAVARLSPEQRVALLTAGGRGPILRSDRRGARGEHGRSQESYIPRSYRACSRLGQSWLGGPMTTARWETLPCGADPEQLVEYAAEGSDAPVGSHEAGCAYCQAALREFAELWLPMRQWSERDISVPRRFVATVMSRVWRIVQSPRHAVSASGRGATMVTSWALGLIAATATEDTPGVSAITGRPARLGRRAVVRCSADGVDIDEVEDGAISVTLAVTAGPVHELDRTGWCCPPQRDRCHRRPHSIERRCRRRQHRGPRRAPAIVVPGPGTAGQT